MRARVALGVAAGALALVWFTGCTSVIGGADGGSNTGSSTPGPGLSGVCAVVAVGDADSGYSPGYRVTVTNPGPEPVEVSGWVVVFYRAGVEIGQDEGGPTDTGGSLGAYITAGQSMTWTPAPFVLPYNVDAAGNVDPAVSCQLISWS